MNRFRNLPVGLRLTLGFGACGALLLAIAAFAWWVIAGMKQSVDVIVAENNRKSELAWHMRADLEAVARAVRNVIVTRDAAVQAKQREAQAAARSRFDPAHQALGELLVDDEERALHAKIGQLRGVVLPLLDEVMDQASRGMKEMASETLIEKVQGPQTEWIDAMQGLIDLQSRRTAERVEAMGRQQRLSTLALLGGMVLAVLLSVAMGAAITRTLVRQLGGEPRYARDVARRIAAGDLGEAIQLRPGDRDSLLAAMTEMQLSLRTMVSGIQQSADAVLAASAEIAQGNQDLSARTEQQAANLQRTSSAMTELTETVRHSTASARQASDLASTASGVAARGSEAVGEVVQRMNEIQASSQRVTEIIGVIDGIAFQTNILALNAAVEAARAGEQGRGFAVVASEVRSLAQRSAEAAKEIAALISDSVDRVEGGNRLVKQAGTTMAEIVQRVQEVSTLMSEITAASVQQEDGIGDIGKAVYDLDTTTQHNAALVEENAAAAGSLREQATRLAQTVGQFRLSEAALAQAEAAAPAAGMPLAASPA
ncbi:methyl-accepting chemotaxis protein [Piscinibacter sp. HJYY11]|uniref:methyl-accepting chemotaxis protein n=1 Tax=Piscinibacter sp. HJYY11 TaxID=2801333 RepID=UPI00191CE7C7|nr:methyl-accepting chemotaxis protein [Piscinibacter sp. HJYY11]MBL0726463.1 MCP four helix bundle domain-containing protein [Piscinibacter sp. HJYY11]